MTTQRRFEAETLAEVVAKVHAELGKDAKISSARKVRSGGVLGFFQRERFEILVDVDESGQATTKTEFSPAAAALAAVPEPAAEAEAPASIMDLADAVNKTERPGAKKTAAAKAKAAAPKPAPAPEPVAEVAPEPAPQPVEVVAAEEDAKISTETDSFAEVLSRMAFQSNLESPEAPKAEPTPAADAPLVAAIADALPSEPTPEVVEVAPDRPAFLDAPTPPVAPEPAPVVQQIVPEPAVPPALKAEIIEAAEPEPTPAPAPEPAPVVVATPVAEERTAPVPTPEELAVVRRLAEGEVVAQRTRITDSPLAQLGLPTTLIPELPERAKLAAIQKALEATLQNLPEPPHIRPSKGSVIAVVGDRDEAQTLAEDLALKWGRPKEEIVLASQNYRGRTTRTVVRSVRNAEDSRRSWSRRPRPTIVVIDTPLGSEATVWAEHILSTLEPIATYGVADATRKAEDISAWASALGGLDALALNHVEQTVSPASVLSIGIPVDTIDGRPATPAFWAMLLAERLTAA